MKLSTRLNLAAMRVAGVLLATIKWSWEDVRDSIAGIIEPLVELVGNVLWLVFSIVVNPFLKFRKAWSLRKHITETTTWRKQRKSAP